MAMSMIGPFWLICSFPQFSSSSNSDALIVFAGFFSKDLLRQMIRDKAASALLLAASLPWGLSSPVHHSQPRLDFAARAKFSHQKVFTLTNNIILVGLYTADKGADPKSVSVKHGYLVLTVPGTDTTCYKKYQSEVITAVDNIFYQVWVPS